jgi:hypothetical protein
VAANRDTSRRSSLVIGSRPPLCSRGTPWLVDAGTAEDRGRTTSTPVPIVVSTSRTDSPPLGSAKFITTCRPAGIMHSSRRTSSSLRSPRTPGTSMLLSITTSVARSSAASVCSDRPGAVSTTT